MATIIRTEKRKRGLFGWVFLILFWGFNLLMLVTTLAGLAGTGEQMQAAVSDAERAGTAIGTALGMGVIMAIWLPGAALLGIFVWLTSGKKIITETTTEG
ncbi:hypothetical protein ACN9JG_06150 [Cereibacter azotoformans]|uniref:hypothetical protein n=1 Tax=Cereibacter azotoformans TaxID=43057 RepID=UPI003B218EE2